MNKDTPINESVFSEEFSDTGLLETEIFLLSSENALHFWQEYIDQKAASYFSLQEDNWLIKSEQTVIGRWILAFNENKIQEIETVLDACVLWESNDAVYFCISKHFVIKSPWRKFKELWISFLECEDDCPIIINKRDIGCALIFSPLGDIIKAENKITDAS